MKKMRAKKLQKAIALGMAGVATLLVGTLAQQSHADNLTSVSATLSNSRLSFSGEVGAGNSAGSTILDIDTTGVPSPSTNQVVVGDTITINGNSYTVQEIIDTDTLSIDPGLVSLDETADTAIYDPQTTNFTVDFTTASAISGGAFRVLIPAAASSNSDGTPDQGKFDANGAVAADITCPSDTGSHDFSTTPDKTVGTTTIDGNTYHYFECGYAGSGSAGTALTMTIADIINPAPEGSHTSGTADSHTVIVQHLDSGSTVLDTTSTSVGIIEAVRVTATVAPQLSFSIAGVASSQTKCNISTDVTTTAYSVPFGELDLSSFIDAAQTMTVSTNGSGGYAVTALANDQLSKGGSGCTNTDPVTATDTDCIQDARGDTSTMTHTTADEFADTANKGFAYSLENDDANTISFQYSDTTGGCSGTFCAKQFADSEGSESSQNIFSSSTVADAENVDVCYRIIPATTTEAGDYANYVTYTATATF